MGGLSYQQCKECVEEVLRAAADIERPVAVALVDAHGDLMTFARTERSPARCVALSINKAYTAASMQRDTTQVAARLKEKDFELSWFGDARYTAIAGGVAIIVDGECVGGIGVSGARTPEEDHTVARRGLARLLEVK